jgi:hypothetical protein
LDEFLIQSAAGAASLLFYDRTPADRGQPVAEFQVRLTDHNLSAAGRVYAGYSHAHPAPLFAEMARQWAGWQGELHWRSLEGELTLRCGRDRLGHISIRVELRFGPLHDDWRAAATVMVEAGQLERLARQASTFFGQTARNA